MLGGYHIFFIPFKFGFHKQDRLPKVSVLIFFNLKNLYTKSGYQYFYWNLASSHDADSHKFENSQLSFDDSHKPIIALFFQIKNKIKITNKLYILNLKNHNYS